MITSAGLRDLINNFNDSLLEQKFDLHKLDTLEKNLTGLVSSKSSIALLGLAIQ